MLYIIQLNKYIVVSCSTCRHTTSHPVYNIGEVGIVPSQKDYPPPAARVSKKTCIREIYYMDNIFHQRLYLRLLSKLWPSHMILYARRHRGYINHHTREGPQVFLKHDKRDHQGGALNYTVIYVTTNIPTHSHAYAYAN